MTTRNPKPFFLMDLGHMYKTILRVKVNKIMKNVIGAGW